MAFLLLLTIVLFAIPAGAQITLAPSGVFSAGGNAAAEIPAYDPVTKRVFSVNGSSARVDVIDIADPSLPALAFTIPVSGLPNSVSVCNGIVGVAVEASPKTDPGKVEFFDTSGASLGSAAVGALPDMLTFTPNCRFVLVANEGEPNSYNQPSSIDPEGSVSVIDIGPGISNAIVRTARFDANIVRPSDHGIRFFGPNATFEQDMEPEYIAVSDDGKQAWVTLQEANAIARLDIEQARFITITGLGYKDHTLLQNVLDPSDRDGGIKIANWPVLGMYQPDGIAFARIGSEPYLLVANEGDARSYTGFSEEVRVRSAILDPVAFPNAAVLQQDPNLGRLNVTTTGDIDNDSDLDYLLPFGARSFSIRNTAGFLVWDSSAEFENQTAVLAPSLFNSDGTAATFDTRSDNKGPEPEGVVVGKVGDRTYAFVGLERIGGIMVYDISTPQSPKFVQHATSPGDISPEGIVFIAAASSPNGKPLLVVSHEISGTVRIFQINAN